MHLCCRRGSNVAFAPTRRRAPAPQEEKTERDSSPGRVAPDPEQKLRPVEDPMRPANPLSGLADARRQKGLSPGQLDVDSSVFARRKTDLAQRKSFLRNFWYAAGEPTGSAL